MADGTAGGAVVITGAARGIGAAIGRRFARAGHTVFGIDLDGELMAAEAASWPGSHTAVRADVTDEEAVGEVCAEAAQTTGGLRVFVANAGHFAAGPSTEFPKESWQRLLDIHLTSCFTGARQAVSRMPDGGSVVVMSSINGQRGFPGRAAYGAAKAGVAGLVKGLAAEWGARSVRVNAIAPGSIHTELSADAIERGVIKEEKFLARIPMGRFGEPDEVAELAYFLGSPLSSYITGTLIPVDGGWLAQGIDE